MTNNTDLTELIQENHQTKSKNSKNSNNKDFQNWNNIVFLNVHFFNKKIINHKKKTGKYGSYKEEKLSQVISDNDLIDKLLNQISSFK